MTREIEILIVEDSPTQAAHLKDVLERHNYRVAVASSGEEALASIRARKPTIVISDILMPGMDGYELCRRIKADETLRDVPVILLTALSDPLDVVRGLQCEADNFIVKSSREELLLSRIQYILANRELRKHTKAEVGFEIFFAGQKHFLTAERLQIVDLLFSTFEQAIEKSLELERANKQLESALETVKTLHEILPICAHCKRIRDDKGSWRQLEGYFRERSVAEFSHGICPECLKKHYPGYCKADR